MLVKILGLITALLSGGVNVSVTNNSIRVYGNNNHIQGAKEWKDE